MDKACVACGYVGSFLWSGLVDEVARRRAGYPRVVEDPRAVGRGLQAHHKEDAPQEDVDVLRGEEHLLPAHRSAHSLPQRLALRALLVSGELLVEEHGQHRLVDQPKQHQRHDESDLDAFNE